MPITQSSAAQISSNVLGTVLSQATKEIIAKHHKIWCAGFIWGWILLAGSLCGGCAGGISASGNKTNNDSRLAFALDINIDDATIYSLLSVDSKKEKDLVSSLFRKKLGNKTDATLVIVADFPAAWGVQPRCVTVFPEAINSSPLSYIVSCNGKTPKCMVWELPQKEEFMHTGKAVKSCLVLDMTYDLVLGKWVE